MESIELHAPLMFKYGSQVLLATYTAILMVVPKQRSAFVCFANLVVAFVFITFV